MQTLYRRPLPQPLVAFASPRGQEIFAEALAAGTMRGYFRLAQQFHTQADPAFCSLGSLVVALNALDIDPGRLWRGPWRWFSEELLDCCVPLEQVRTNGMTIDELACLARCNGAAADVHRPNDDGVDVFRTQVIDACSTDDGPVLIAAYDRSALGQTGSGHYSPIAGYHAASDSVLVLDVARFKYPPHWVRLEDLWHALVPLDPSTGRSRGWLQLRRGRAGVSLGFWVELVAPSWGAFQETLTEFLSQVGEPDISIEEAASLYLNGLFDSGLRMRSQACETPQHTDAVVELRAHLDDTAIWALTERIQSPLDPLPSALLLATAPAQFRDLLSKPVGEAWAQMVASAPDGVQGEVDRVRAQLEALLDTHVE